MLVLPLATELSQADCVYVCALCFCPRFMRDHVDLQRRRLFGNTTLTYEYDNPSQSVAHLFLRIPSPPSCFLYLLLVRSSTVLRTFPDPKAARRFLVFRLTGPRLWIHTHGTDLAVVQDCYVYAGLSFPSRAYDLRAYPH